jgi:integrase
MAAGIETRHARSCRQRQGGRCNCEPTYRVRLWDGQRQQRIVKPFQSYAEAQGWRKDALISLRRGRTPDTGADTLQAAADSWLEGARQGVIRTRSGDPYKPAAIRSYEASLRLRVLPELGTEPLADIRRADLQDLVERLAAEGVAENTIEATFIPLRSIFRREVHRDRLKVNPCAGLELPKAKTRRDRIASPVEGARLLAALPQGDRPLWATAMYAGLRRGELRALRAHRLDLPNRIIHVERGWDDREGEIETKGRNRRRVPIPTVLEEYLLDQAIRTGRSGADLVFGDADNRPFNPKHLTVRADEAWTSAKLHRITLHECRHTFASLMIAAGVNAKALSEYMGHANISITFDRYGHLMPGNEAQAADLLDAYLLRETETAGG